MLGTCGDAIGAGGVLARHQAGDAELLAHFLDAVVISRDDRVVKALSFLASLVDVPQQRLAAEHGQGLAGKS
ncbi:hypothetical protein GCM10010341_88550 [Streptomyces noursei]|nr:hypothetical protein GCM10010341_88550 [Streptomyces noursei]